ncbi:MAG TPA: hypothetical protein VN541_15460 [Tepidisphaeraceae bacterium]|nr:hypothetical protein [Tepidisphaeraceae bacterium]
MAKAPAKSKNKVHIDAALDGAREFVLHPESNDLFVRTGKQVIEACQLGISVEVWLTELSGMLERVIRWAGERATRVRSCFVSPAGSKTVLFFVPTSEQFDFDLADELTDLTSELLKEYNVGMVELGQIPWAELDRFLDPRTAIHIYGEQQEPHRSVEA